MKKLYLKKYNLDYKKIFNMYSNRLDKKLTDKLISEYNSECYSGATSYLFKLSHRLMEKKKPTYKNILEVSAGLHPHIDYIKHNFENYFFVVKIQNLQLII